MADVNEDTETPEANEGDPTKEEAPKKKAVKKEPEFPSAIKVLNQNRKRGYEITVPKGSGDTNSYTLTPKIGNFRLSNLTRAQYESIRSQVQQCPGVCIIPL